MGHKRRRLLTPRGDDGACYNYCYDDGVLVKETDALGTIRFDVYDPDVYESYVTVRIYNRDVNATDNQDDNFTEHTFSTVCEAKRFESDKLSQEWQSRSGDDSEYPLRLVDCQEIQLSNTPFVAGSVASLYEEETTVTNKFGNAVFKPLSEFNYATCPSKEDWEEVDGKATCLARDASGDCALSGCNDQTGYAEFSNGDDYESESDVSSCEEAREKTKDDVDGYSCEYFEPTTNVFCGGYDCDFENDGNILTSTFVDRYGANCDELEAWVVKNGKALEYGKKADANGLDVDSQNSSRLAEAPLPPMPDNAPSIPEFAFAPTKRVYVELFEEDLDGSCNLLPQVNFIVADLAWIENSAGLWMSFTPTTPEAGLENPIFELLPNYERHRPLYVEVGRNVWGHTLFDLETEGNDPSLSSHLWSHQLEGESLSLNDLTLTSHLKTPNVNCSNMRFRIEEY